MDLTVIDPRNLRDIAPLLLDPQGRLRVVPAATLEATTRAERSMFGVRHAYYGLLTEELVQHLRALIGSQSAIEIGAGHGGLAQALGIPATDSRQQEDPAIASYYHSLQQPVVRYGAHVEKLDALAAIERYRPDVVIGQWVTHRWDPRRPEAGGNMDGIHEESVIERVRCYVMIGNEKVHAAKSIWSLPHERITPPWLFSRAHNGSPDFIAVWKGGRR